MAAQFQEQVSTVVEWFKAWNECEQVVVLCSLLRRISSIQTKFLEQVFKQMFDTCTDLDLELLEKQANDPEFVSGLCKESKSVVMSQLLKTLPLLRAGNDKAKMVYLRIIHKVMAHSIEHGIHREECRHILSYLILHPAFSREDLPLVGIWQNGLSEAQSSNPATKGSNLAFGAPHIAPNIKVVASSSQLGMASVSAPMPQTSLGPDGTNILDCVPGSDLDSRISLLGNWSNGSHSQWTLASSGRDSGFSEVERSPSITGAPVGRPLKSSTSAPLTNVAHSELIHQITGQMVQPHALLSRAPRDSDHSLDKCTVQLDSHPPKLLFQPRPNVVSDNAPSTVTDWLNRHQQPAPAGNRVHLFVNNPDSLHAPLSPQSSITSSGSGGSGMGELHLDERRRSQTEDESGMRDVSLWLKSLRLHKYAYLFQNISYEEMLNLTEERLEEQKVTKGARNKIIISVKKLQSRQETLRSLEKNLMVAGNIKETISEMMQMLRTPIKRCEESYKSLTLELGNVGPSVIGTGKCLAVPTAKENEERSLASEADSIADGDLPGQMTRLLGKICTQLLVGTRADGECVGGYLQLLDRSLSHQAFNIEQKKKMTSWKQQIYRCFHLHAIQKQNLEWQRLSGENALPAPGAPHVERRALRGQQVLTSPGQPSWSFGAMGPRPATSVSTALMLPGQYPEPTAASSHPKYQSEFPLLAAETSGLEGKQLLGRTKSAPIRSAQMGFAYMNAPVLFQESCSNDDINASLDSLCISMTEHALAGGFGDSL